MTANSASQPAGPLPPTSARLRRAQEPSSRKREDSRKTSLRTLEQRRGQWLKGVLDLCVLGMVRDRDAYGYELGQDLEFSGLGPIKGGTLYPVLSRLENEGFLQTFWRASDLGPDRKYYRITPAGTDVVNEMGKAWFTFSESVGNVISEGCSG